MFNNQGLLWLLIIFSILMTLLCDSKVILGREILCKSLLRIKGRLILIYYKLTHVDHKRIPRLVEMKNNPDSFASFIDFVHIVLGRNLSNITKFGCLLKFLYFCQSLLSSNKTNYINKNNTQYSNTQIILKYSNVEKW